MLQNWRKKLLKMKVLKMQTQSRGKSESSELQGISGKVLLMGTCLIWSYCFCPGPNETSIYNRIGKGLPVGKILGMIFPQISNLVSLTQQNSALGNGFL